MLARVLGTRLEAYISRPSVSSAFSLRSVFGLHASSLRLQSSVFIAFVSRAICVYVSSLVLWITVTFFLWITVIAFVGLPFTVAARLD